LSITATAQQSLLKSISDDEIITFNSKGQMISFPRVFVPQVATLKFQTLVPRSVLDQQLIDFKTSLEKTITYLNDSKVNNYYTCIFKIDDNSNYRDLYLNDASAAINILTGLLNSKYKLRDADKTFDKNKLLTEDVLLSKGSVMEADLTIKKGTAKKNNFPLTKDFILKKGDVLRDDFVILTGQSLQNDIVFKKGTLIGIKFLASKAEIKTRVEQLLNEADDLTYIPLGDFLKKQAEQYTVEIYKADDFVGSVKLSGIPAMFNTDTCIYFSAALTEKARKSLCSSCEISKDYDFHYKLIYNDPWKNTVQNWYNGRTSAFTKILTGDPNALQNIKKEINSLSTSTTGDKSTSLDNLLNLKRWLVNWFWFNGGKLQLDPFSQKGEKFVNVQKEKITANELKIKQLKEKILFVDSARLKVNEELKNFDDFEKAQTKLAEINEAIVKLTKENESLQKTITVAALLTSVKEKKVFYDGYLKFSSLFGEANVQKQFDAANSYRQIPYKRADKWKVNEVPNSEKLHIIVHNIPYGTNIRISENNLAFADDELFTKLVSEQLSKVDFTSLSASQITGATSFFNEILKVQEPGNKGASLVADCSTLQDYTAFFKPLQDELDQEVAFPAKLGLFDQLNETAPEFRSKIFSSGIESSDAYKDSITIKRYIGVDSTKLENVRKTFVAVGKPRYVIISAGIAVNRDAVNESHIDTAGNGFRVSSAETRSRFIFGFKLYPFGNYNRDHYPIPRFFLRRFSLFGGAEILKPLNNFYAGLAYDVVPGLAVSAGKNFTQQTRYSIQNNVITKTSRSYANSGIYYAVLVNPTLFIQFVKLFFK